MNYQECREYIKDSEKYGSVLGLANMRELMKRLGDPQDRLSIVHVAGTNGKGSVIAYLYQVLGEAGYRTGRYNSPTLFSYRERMEIDHEAVSREEFAVCVTEVKEAIDQMTAEGLTHPTTFEIETAAAFVYFARGNCDIVLLEVGMGGDQDATNIIKAPVLSVLVSISMDHMGFLGNSLAEIAEKKAGILKKGCSMITVKQKDEAEAVIRRVCMEQGIAFHEADPGKAELLEEGVEGQSFCYEGEEYRISLSGVYQKENAVLALEALKILGECGWPSTMEQRKKGLAETRWRGRFTVLRRKPLFVVDGAHNQGAADTLEESVRRYFKDKTIYYIIGMFGDKDYRYVLKKMAPYARKILTIQTPDNPRALPAKQLAEEARAYHRDVEACGSIEEAVRRALALASEEDVILAFGSLSFIGTLTDIVEKESN